MKRILLLLLLFPMLLHAQVDLRQTDTASMIFVRVIEVEGKSGAQLFGLAKVALADFFAGNSAVMQTEDAVNGTLIARAGFSYDYMVMLHNYTGWVDYTLRIDAKEGRLRMAMYGFYHSYTGQDARDYGGGGALSNERPAISAIIFPVKKWALCIRRAYGETGSVLDALQRGVQHNSNSDW